MSQSDILLESGTNELEIVEFYLDEYQDDGTEYRGYYGVNVAKVLEIIRLPKVTGMPQTPHPSVMGTFNLRDKIVPLIDLSSWLGKSLVENEVFKVIVTEFNNVINAFMVSGVTRIHRLSWEQIEPPSIQVQNYSGESITGVVKMSNRVVFILDMEKIVGELNPSLALKHLDAETFRREHMQDEHGDFVYKALIADDSSTLRHLIGASLEQANFDVTRTINGGEAYKQLLAWKERAVEEDRPITDYVHVVVSDIEMPAMDGHNLTKRIKEDPVLGTLPVILFSSLITDRLRHKGERVGADDQISKPEMSGLAGRARDLARKHLFGE